jgi:hypothetical protein
MREHVSLQAPLKSSSTLMIPHMRPAIISCNLLQHERMCYKSLLFLSSPSRQCFKVGSKRRYATIQRGNAPTLSHSPPSIAQFSPTCQRPPVPAAEKFSNQKPPRHVLPHRQHHTQTTGQDLMVLFAAGTIRWHRQRATAMRS